MLKTSQNDRKENRLRTKSNQQRKQVQRKPVYLLVYTGRGQESCLCQGVVLREPSKKNKTFKILITSINLSAVYGSGEQNVSLLKKLIGLKVNRNQGQLHSQVPPWMQNKISNNWVSMKPSTIEQKIRTRKC